MVSNPHINKQFDIETVKILSENLSISVSFLKRICTDIVADSFSCIF